MLLMEKHRMYVQDINSPTVVRGKEKLRIAPTPFHTPAMQEEFVKAVVDVWQELGLKFVESKQWHFGLADVLANKIVGNSVGAVQLAAV